MSFVITGFKYIFAIFILYRDTTGSSAEKQELMTAKIGGWLVALDIIFMASSVIAGLYGLYTWWKEDGKAFRNDDSPADDEEKSNKNKKTTPNGSMNPLSTKKRGVKVQPTTNAVRDNLNIATTNAVRDNLNIERNSEKANRFWELS